MIKKFLKPTPFKIIITLFLLLFAPIIIYKTDSFHCAFNSTCFYETETISIIGMLNQAIPFKKISGIFTGGLILLAFGDYLIGCYLIFFFDGLLFLRTKTKKSVNK